MQTQASNGHMQVTSGRFLSRSERNLRWRLVQDIGLNHIWDIDALPWDTFRQLSRKTFYHSIVTSLNPELLDAIKPHAEAVSEDLPKTNEQFISDLRLHSSTSSSH
ncbi:hypothetical protein BDZ45DRAFT_670440 [Acephala macrosclerotiorum]|nr:hypothetical protein BDZ45DRAFT_670440 [Acephala macrosclerotiorum]